MRKTFKNSFVENGTCLLITFLLILAVTSCGTMRYGVKDHSNIIKQAKQLSKNGKYEAALAKLDKAEAKVDRERKSQGLRSWIVHMYYSLYLAKRDVYSDMADYANAREAYSRYKYYKNLYNDPNFQKKEQARLDELTRKWDTGTTYTPKTTASKQQDSQVYNQQNSVAPIASSAAAARQRARSQREAERQRALQRSKLKAQRDYERRKAEWQRQQKQWANNQTTAKKWRDAEGCLRFKKGKLANYICNDCNFKIFFRFCYDNPEHHFSCAKRNAGADAVGPNKCSAITGTLMGGPTAGKIRYTWCEFGCHPADPWTAR